MQATPDMRDLLLLLLLLVLLVPLPTLLVLLVLRLTDGNLRHSGFPSSRRCRPAEVTRTTSRMMVWDDGRLFAESPRAAPEPMGAPSTTRYPICKTSADQTNLQDFIFGSRPTLLDPLSPYRANPNYLRNPKFCVGCFEFYLSKILRQHLKQGGGGELRFFSAEPIFAERIDIKVFLFLRFFLRNPFLRRAWGTLDSGIAVQSYTGIQMLIIWTVGLQSNPLNNQNQITMDPSWTELAPLSALGHSNIKMQVSGSARTRPFICFGAHQYPKSNNDGPQLDRTSPIICFGAQQHQNANIRVCEN